MKLNANIPGIQELTTEEMKDTNGGLLWLIPVVILLGGCATTGTNSTETPVNSASGPA